MSDPLDMTALRNLKDMLGGDPEDLSELIEDFVAALPKQVQDMQGFGASGDLAALRRVAHSCKSNARDLGALTLADLCAQLEADSAAGTLSNVEDHLSKISAAADTALAHFAALNVLDV